jgi:glycosyltransferase 2 family protein
VVLAVAARHAGDVSASERALYDLVASLPDQVDPVFLAIYRLGALWAVGLVVVAALAGRRWRLGRDLLVAGAIAWLVARSTGEIVVAHENFGRSVRIATALGGSPPFPAVRVAIVVAVICAAGPYVTRPTRVVGRVLVVAVGIAALTLGRAYPNDLFAAVVLGWTVAAAVHLLFGSPGGRPTVEQVRAALAQLGIAVDDVRLADVQPAGSTLMFADHADQLVRVKVLGRDQTDARLLAKLWRAALYRDSGPPLALTRLHQVEREAYLMLVARDAGVRVPPVLVAGSAGAGSACLVVGTVGAVPLAELGPEQVTDELLATIWRNVAALHRVRVTHGRLDADHVVVSAGQPWIVGFDDARSTSRPESQALDVAELLTATAGVVGDERAIRAAVDVLGREPVVAALPLLQSEVLTDVNRRRAGAGRSDVRRRLEHLRAVGAASTGVPAPELTQLRRIEPVSAAMALGALVAIAVLLYDVGDPEAVWVTVRSAEWSWIAVACFFSLVSNIGFAIGLMGTVPRRLPLWPTTEVQIAMSFSNLAIPAIGGQGMQIRYLQRMGVDLSSAVAAGGVLSAAGNLVAALALFVLAVAVEPAHADFTLLPTTGLIELTAIVVVAVSAVSVVLVSIPRLRQATLPALRRAALTMYVVLRSPRRVTLLLGGYGLATLLATCCLQACLIAFGGSASFWSLLAANIGVMTVASVVPVPGGGTAVGTIGLSAVLVSFGVAEHVAVAAVLANQLIYYYLPAVPGWFATRHLVSNDYL